DGVFKVLTRTLPLTEDSHGLLLEGLKWINGVWKPLTLLTSPAFIIRNWIEDVFKMTMAGMDYRDTTMLPVVGKGVHSRITEAEKILAAYDIANGITRAGEPGFASARRFKKYLKTMFKDKNEALQFLKSKADDLGMTYEELLNRAKAHGLMEGLTESELYRGAHNFIDREFMNQARKSGAALTFGDRVRNFFTIMGDPFQYPLGIGYILRKMGKANTRWELRRRLALFADGLANGLRPEEAAQRVRDYLFDYSHHTQFDLMMKNFIPFWTFFKQNIPFWMKHIQESPVILHYLYNKEMYQHNRPKEEEFVIPEYLKDGIRVSVVEKESYDIAGNRKVSRRDYYLYSLGLGYEDLERITFNGPMGGLWKSFNRLIISSLNPLLKTAIEVSSGRNMMFDTRFREHAKAYPVIKLLASAPVMRQISGYREVVKPDGNVEYYVSPYFLSMLINSPAGRAYAMLGKLTEGAMKSSKEDYQPILYAIMNVMGLPRVSSFDYDSQLRRVLRDRFFDIARAAGVEVREYKGQLAVSRSDLEKLPIEGRALLSTVTGRPPQPTNKEILTMLQRYIEGAEYEMIEKKNILEDYVLNLRANGASEKHPYFIDQYTKLKNSYLEAKKRYMAASRQMARFIKYSKQKWQRYLPNE
ncbi:MAG: hypothetical protein D6710_09335, partial [Nitrospirae bacterium]